MLVCPFRGVSIPPDSRNNLTVDDSMHNLAMADESAPPIGCSIKWNHGKKVPKRVYRRLVQ
jgi:hypothetical protein